MTEDTHELDAVAAAHLPARWKPEYARRWLVGRLNRGDLRGVRYGRWDWKMRDRDIEYMLARYANDDHTVSQSGRAVTQTEAASVADGLSERSRRRLRNVS